MRSLQSGTDLKRLLKEESREGESDVRMPTPPPTSSLSLVAPPPPHTGYSFLSLLPLHALTLMPGFSYLCAPWESGPSPPPPPRTRELGLSPSPSPNEY